MRLWLLRLLLFLLLTLGGSLIWAMLDRHAMSADELLAQRTAQRVASLESVGRLLAEWLEQGDAASLTAYLQTQRARGLEYSLLDPQGRLVVGQPPEPDLQDVITRAAQAGGYASRETESPGLLAPPPMAPPPLEGLAFDVAGIGRHVLALRRLLPPQPLLRRPRHQLYMVLGAGVAVLACLALYRGARASSRDLRTAMHRLAQGDLDVRLDTSLGRQEKPFADLAVDFNQAVTRLADRQAEQRYLLTELAHSMSASLTRMAMAVELADNTSPERTAQLIERIRQDAGSLHGISGQLMDCVRQEWDQSEKRPVALVSLLRMVLAETAVEGRGQSARAELVSEGEPCVFGHPMQLASMLRNVLANALRHSPQGGRVLVLLTAGEQHARIEILDQGPGLPPEMLTRVFLPFQQGPGRRGAAGLGLAIARLVCERHGGTITLDNRPEGGLRATIQLPLRREDAKKGAPEHGTPLLTGAS